MTPDNWRRCWLAAAGVLGASAVALGAYGAHGLSGAPQDWAEKASRYGLIHAVALLALAQSARTGRFRLAAGLLFMVGAALFCGALTAMAVFNLPAGPVAPFGGGAFILGWLSLAIAAVTEKLPPGD